MDRDSKHETGLTMTRRAFLQALGGGIVILFLGDDVLAQRAGRPGLPEDFNAFLRIGEDGRVTCYTGKIEMGQGVVTSLAQELADELDVPLDAIDMVMGDTDLCPWDAGTHGSMSTRFFGPALRSAGAKARGVLLDLAAEKLGRPVERLDVEKGVVFDRTDRAARVSYADLTKGQRIVREMKTPVAVKSPESFQVIGTPTPRRDALEKVTGKAKYTGDIRPEGMLYAKILRPPAHGAALKSADTSRVSEVPGARVVRDGDLIAVLHAQPDAAERALAKVKAEWDSPKLDVDDKSIFDHLLKVADAGDTVAQGGDLKAGEANAASVVDTTYLNSYVAHAPMEPHTATAKVEGKKITVWAATQSPFPARDEVARALSCPPEDVRIITPYVGGGFGGKGRNLQVVEAARLAKLAGAPVQVAWTRSEEFFDDSFRPAAIVKIRSGLTKEGGIAFWDYHVYYAGSRGAEQFYTIPNHATVSHGSGWGTAAGTHPFATGAWRAPGNNTNTFARESQIDILARKTGADPVDFRRKHLGDAKMRGVLDAAAKTFGWTATPPRGKGYGVALGIDAGTYVATMAEVEVDEKTGAVRVNRVVCAQDMGLAVNPEGAKIQMEGCITMGLGYALTEEVRFTGGAIHDRNFDTYEIPKFSWLPKIETVLLQDRTAAPQGGGEPAIITMGAVLANAVCSATGARLLQLPMTPERVLAALTKR